MKNTTLKSTWKKRIARWIETELITAGILVGITLVIYGITLFF